MEAQGRGERGFGLRLERVRADALEGGGDGGIVGGGGGEGFLREAPLGFVREGAAGAFEFAGDGIVVGGGSDDGDVVKILGGRADHGGAADIDVLDQFFEGDSGLGRGFLEGVEIHDDHVDGGDAVLGDGGDVLGIFAAMEDAAVDFGMKRLDAAVEHFRESGEFGDVFDHDAGVAEELGGAAGGDEFDAEGGELAGEIDESGFVGDAENGAANLGRCRHDGPLTRCRNDEWRLEILSAAAVARAKGSVEKDRAEFINTKGTKYHEGSAKDAKKGDTGRGSRFTRSGSNLESNASRDFKI